MYRYDIINALIRKNGYKTYLEIGVDNRDLCFNKIQCEHMECVDPAPTAKADHMKTSDDFFKSNQNKFDIVFIDGLHESEQVIRDIDNSLRFLNDGGTIVCHDCNPSTKEMQLVPRVQGEWTGDVWKAILHHRKNPNLNICVVDTDYGVGVIRRGTQEPLKSVDDLTYEQFSADKKRLLNLLPVSEFRKQIPMISVCIPTFEQYGHGADSIRNLFNSMKNQKGDFEVVISDNSAGDEILNVCKQFPLLNIKYVKNLDKIGISNNTNNAIDNASCDLIKIMYMDDIFLDDKALVLFTEALNKRPWVVSHTKKVDGTGRISSSHKPVWNDDILTGRNTMGMPSILAFRKNDFRFDPNLKTLLDCEFMWLMWDKYGPPSLLSGHLIGLRYWEGSTSRKQGNHAEEEYEYLKLKHNLN